MAVSTIGSILQLYLDDAFKIAKGKQVVTLVSLDEYRAFDRLLAICRDFFGANDTEGFQRAIAKVALFSDQTQAEVQRLPLADFLRRLKKALAAETKGGKADKPKVGVGKRTPKATVEARVAELVLKDSATHSWSCRKFAKKLGCVHSAVFATKTYKNLKTVREMARQERNERSRKKQQLKKADRHRKPMHRSGFDKGQQD